MIVALEIKMVFVIIDIPLVEVAVGLVGTASNLPQSIAGGVGKGAFATFFETISPNSFFNLLI